MKTAWGSGVTIPGRMETVDPKARLDCGGLCTRRVLADAVHAPGLQRIIVVVSAWGRISAGRASVKATAEADKAYLTTDDPGFENAQDICEEIDASRP